MCEVAELVTGEQLQGRLLEILRRQFLESEAGNLERNKLIFIAGSTSR